MIKFYRSLVVIGSNENTNIVCNKNIEVIDVALVYLFLSLDICHNLINVSFVDFEQVVSWKSTYPLICKNIYDLSFSKRAAQCWKVDLDRKIQVAWWVKVFKNGPSKICGRQPLKKLKWYGLPKIFKGCLPQISLGPFLNTLTHINVSTIASIGGKTVRYTEFFYDNLNIFVLLKAEKKCPIWVRFFIL